MVALSWRVIRLDFKSALIAGFKNIHQLEFDHVKFYSEEEMMEVVASFPSLTHLRVTATQYHRSIPSTSSILLPSGLEALDISANLANAFYTLLGPRWSCGKPLPRNFRLGGY
jgi:hypothetical protein